MSEPSVQHYLRMRRAQPLLGLGDTLHQIHTGSKFEAELRLSDVEKLATERAGLATAITTLLPEPAKELGDLESITLTLYVGEIREVLKVARGGGA